MLTCVETYAKPNNYSCLGTDNFINPSLYFVHASSDTKKHEQKHKNHAKKSFKNPKKTHFKTPMQKQTQTKTNQPETTERNNPCLCKFTFEFPSKGYIGTYYDVYDCEYRKTYFIRLDNGQLVKPIRSINRGCTYGCISREEEWKLEPGLYLEIYIERYSCKSPYRVVIEKVQFTGDKIIHTILDDFFTHDITPLLRWGDDT